MTKYNREDDVDQYWVYETLAMPRATVPPLSPAAIQELILASERILEREPHRIAESRAAMHMVLMALAIDEAEPESMRRLSRHIARLDMHIRRRREARLKLVGEDI